MPCGPSDHVQLYADNLICMDLCCCSSSEALKLLGSEVHVYTSITIAVRIHKYSLLNFVVLRI